MIAGGLELQLAIMTTMAGQTFMSQTWEKIVFTITITMEPLQT